MGRPLGPDAIRAGGWTLAVAAVAGLSGFGVHQVLAEPAVAARPVAASSVILPTAPAGASPATTSRRPVAPPADQVAHAAPSRTASAAASSPAASPSDSGGPSASPARAVGGPSAAPSASAAPASAAATGRQTYTVQGGQVVLELDASSATLVSAVPAPGWQVRVWRRSGWLQVAFTSAGDVSAVSCSWQGHPPQVRTFTA